MYMYSIVYFMLTHCNKHTMSCASLKERVERKRAKEEAYKEAEELLRQREMDG